MAPEKHALKATYSHQNAAFQSDLPDVKSQYRRTISHQGYSTLTEEVTPKAKHELFSAPLDSSAIHAVETTRSETHRVIKTGRQRFRWNLLFNLLVWTICPLPIWLPFVSNQVALYLLPSIQALFVLIWLIISLCAARNAWILFR